MSEWNQCQFIGHVGTPPQTKPTQAGNLLTTFTLGVGQGKDRPTLWLFIKTMQPCEFGKKTKVKINGRLFFEEWTKDAQKKTMWGAFANTVEVVSQAPAAVPPPPAESTEDDDAPC